MERTRKNQPRSVTEEKIRSLIGEILSNGGNMFPSERDLTARLGASRVTIRSILEELEKEGILEQSSNGRIINPSASRIPVMFITRGRNIATNPAWMRLWMAIFALSEKTALAPKLELIGYWQEEIEADLAEIRKSEAKYIIITHLEDLPDDILGKWNAEERNIIIVDEHFCNSGYPVIGLDNFEAGFLAAQTIAEKGYRNPAYFDECFAPADYTPNLKRLDGFAAGCRKYGMTFDMKKNIYSISDRKIHSYIESVKQIAEKKQNIDSLFVSTDDHVSMISELLAEEGFLLPDDLGIITLNAQNIAVLKGFDCVSHATYEVAAALVENIQNHAYKKIEKIESILIKPTIHKGESLCRRNLK